MDWKSNFDEDELRRIEQIQKYKKQIGYDEGSDLWILAVVVDILDNAEEIINKPKPYGIHNPAHPKPDFTKPIRYQGPRRPI